MSIYPLQDRGISLLLPGFRAYTSVLEAALFRHVGRKLVAEEKKLTAY